MKRYKIMKPACITALLLGWVTIASAGEPGHPNTPAVVGLVQKLIAHPASASPAATSFSDPLAPAMSADWVATGGDIANRLEEWSPGKRSLFEVRNFMADPGPLPTMIARRRLSDSAAKAAFARLFPRFPVRDSRISIEFGCLVERWKPIGRSILEVREVMGQPSSEEPGRVIYHFDTGWSGISWVLLLTDDIVSGIVVECTFCG